MDYREHAASPRLRPFVDRIWTLEGPAGSGGLEPVLPDGHVEIIVHAADPFVEAGSDGRPNRQSPVLLAGQLTRATRIGPAGVTRVVGARLRPNGAHALLGFPQAEITDRVVDLGAVHGRLARLLHDDVVGRAPVNDLVAAFDRALLRVVPAHPIVSRVDRAVRLATSRRGVRDVRGLARAAGLGERQLQRAFRDEVGLTPKQLLRILRFQDVLGRLRGAGAPVRGADLAAASGFYDQAHFVNDFKSFTGQTPGDWAIDACSLTAVFSAVRRRHADERDEPVGFFQDILDADD